MALDFSSELFLRESWRLTRRRIKRLAKPVSAAARGRAAVRLLEELVGCNLAAVHVENAAADWYDTPNVFRVSFDITPELLDELAAWRAAEADLEEDPEGDENEDKEPDADGEPSLGWTVDGKQGAWLASQLELEDEHDGREPDVEDWADEEQVGEVA